MYCLTRKNEFAELAGKLLCVRPGMIGWHDWNIGTYAGGEALISGSLNFA